MEIKGNDPDDKRFFRKGKKTFIALIFLCIAGIGAVIYFSRGQKPEEWVEAGENYTGVLLYDKGSVRRDSNGEVTFRTKHIFSPEMCGTLAEASEGFVQASHYVSLDKVNCGKWEYKQMEIVFKDFYGKKIDWPGSKKDSPVQAGYRPIPPNTLMELLAREVCVAQGAGVTKAPDPESSAAAPINPDNRGAITKGRQKELLELEEKGDWEGLIAHCQAWTMAEPGNSYSWSYLGYAYGASGQVTRSIVYFRKALAIDPADGETWFNLGLSYKIAGREKEMREVHRRLEKLDPELARRFYGEVVAKE